MKRLQVSTAPPHCFITWGFDWMSLTDPFHLDVFCDHTMAPGAHQGHFPSPKHLLQEAHVQFILTASLDMRTLVDLDAPFETVPGMCHHSLQSILLLCLLSSHFLLSGGLWCVHRHEHTIYKIFINYHSSGSCPFSSPWCDLAVHKYQTCSRSMFISANIYFAKSNHFWYRNRAWPIKGSSYTKWKMQRRGRWDGSVGSKQTAEQAVSQTLFPGEVIQGLNPLPLCQWLREVGARVWIHLPWIY